MLISRFCFHEVDELIPESLNDNIIRTHFIDCMHSNSKRKEKIYLLLKVKLETLPGLDSESFMYLNIQKHYDEHLQQG